MMLRTAPIAVALCVAAATAGVTRAQRIRPIFNEVSGSTAEKAARSEGRAASRISTHHGNQIDTVTSTSTSAGRWGGSSTADANEAANRASKQATEDAFKRVQANQAAAAERQAAVRAEREQAQTAARERQLAADRTRAAHQQKQLQQEQLQQKQLQRAQEQRVEANRIAAQRKANEDASRVRQQNQQRLDSQRTAKRQADELAARQKRVQLERLATWQRNRVDKLLQESKGNTLGLRRKFQERATPIAEQKQAGHTFGTRSHANRKKNNEGTSTFFGKDSGEKATRMAFERGKPVPGKPHVREHDFGTAVGTGPKGGMQTKVRAHMDNKGRIHGHPAGPEKKR